MKFNFIAHDGYDENDERINPIEFQLIVDSSDDCREKLDGMRINGMIKERKYLNLIGPIEA